MSGGVEQDLARVLNRPYEKRKAQRAFATSLSQALLVLVVGASLATQYLSEALDSGEWWSAESVREIGFALMVGAVLYIALLGHEYRVASANARVEEQRVTVDLHIGMRDELKRRYPSSQLERLVVKTDEGDISVDIGQSDEKMRKFVNDADFHTKVYFHSTYPDEFPLGDSDEDKNVRLLAVAQEVSELNRRERNGEDVADDRKRLSTRLERLTAVEHET